MRSKREARERRRKRNRKELTGTEERPRLSIYRSLKHLHAQLIDDARGRTLLGLSTVIKEFKGGGGNIKGAQKFGLFFGERVLKLNIQKVLFDRGGFLYHGRVKAFADGAREAGLEF